jgi:hypothetical protein
VRSLADLQETFARAMTSGQGVALAAELVGGPNPSARLAIHLRHYEASLTTALCDKFPACAWLAGADLVRAAARDYVHSHPPVQPCIAEYGRDFPQFLAAYGRASSLPYLESFAALEWAVAKASIATAEPPLSWTDVARLGPDALFDSTPSLQPGLYYLSSGWRIDELMTTYLSGAEPERFVLEESNTLIEVRGTRGDVRLKHLDATTFGFRTALLEGRSIGEAAIRALDSDATFDSGAALSELVREGLVTGTSAALQESPR